MKRLLIIVSLAILVCSLSSDVEAWPRHGFGQSGQNVVDDSAVLVVDGNNVQVVAP